MEELLATIEFPESPMCGKKTGQYMTNEDGTVKVPCVAMNPDTSLIQKVKHAINEYKWHDDDFLLATYPKNGTHFMWEIMMMLVRGSADYIQDSKAVCMIDLYPVTESEQVLPSPRVLNTHYRFDVLPKEFRNRKTILVLRNPKDTAVSFYYHCVNMSKMVPSKDVTDYLDKLTFQSYLRSFLADKDGFYGNYFDYVEYMWSLRDDPNILILYFEDLKRDPASVIQQANEFMGTNRSPEIVQQIADATLFSKMKDGKLESSKRVMEQMQKMNVIAGGKNMEPPKAADGAAPMAHAVYRKGEIGDWKNHFTVADNELFEMFLDRWTGGKDIPFRY